MVLNVPLKSGTLAAPLVHSLRRRILASRLPCFQHALRSLGIPGVRPNPIFQGKSGSCRAVGFLPVACYAFSMPYAPGNPWR